MNVSADRQTSSSVDRTKSICDMLVFMIVPDLEIAAKKAAWYESILGDPSIPVFEPGDTASMRQLLASIVKDNITARRVDRVRIGVSSGLDSRICFGATLDVLPADRIHVFTSGHPGNRDFENAPFLLNKRTVHHVLISQQLVGVATGGPKGSRHKYDTEEIVFKGEKYPPGLPNIGGRLGDAISGGHLSLSEPPQSWDQAKAAFCRSFSSSQKILNHMYQEGILPADYVPEDSLPKDPLLDRSLMAYDDQLDLLIRQHQNICLQPGGFDDLNAELVAGGKTADHRNRIGIQPFIDARWQKSFLLTPREKRMKQKLYRRLALEQYADIFPDMVDPEYQMVAPDGATVVDWRVMWRKHKSLSESARTRMEGLNARGGNFDVDRLVDLANRKSQSALKVVQRLCAIEGRAASGLAPGFQSEDPPSQPKQDGRS